MLRILIADDLPLFREALCEIAERIAPECEIVASAGYPTCLDQPGEFAFIVVDTAAETAVLRKRFIGSAIVAFSKTSTRAEIEHAIRSDIGSDIRSDDEALLTPRQSAVLSELARGSSNRQIATHLHIEEITVKAHISAIFRKLHVKSRLEAVIAMRAQHA